MKHIGKIFSTIILIVILALNILAFTSIINITLFNFLMIFITIILLFILILLIIDRNYNSKEEKIKNLVYYDQITNLPNKNKFLNDLQLKLKQKQKYVIIVFDMKNFKDYIEAAGIASVNKFLKFIAETLLNIIDKDELCANIYEEHFALLLKYANNNDIISRINKINDQIVNYSPNFKIVLSFGIYYICDKRYSTSLIFNKADLARKSIVDKYDHLYAFYDEKLKKSSASILDIENYMEESLKKNQFIIYYQPKYSIQRKRLIGFEALVRWNHPKNGILYPEQFISIFEKNGFIKELDFYVLKEICKNIKKWSKLNYKKIPVSFNISREDLKNPDFITNLNDIVEKYEVDKNLIELEFTESIIFSDVNAFINTTKNLHSLGYKMSIDDFGAGHSSLNVLKNIPVDILKIDKEFLKQNNHRGEIIIADTISLAKKLNMKVVIEGVENKNQVTFLKKIGCDYGQGYYYSKPLMLKEVEKLIKK